MERRPAWFVSAALIALGQHRSTRRSEPFSAGDLAGWTAAFDTPANAMLAIKVLVNHKYLDAVPDGTPTKPHRVARWVLTPEGLLAARTALQSEAALPARAYGPMTPADQVDPFAARLWNLLRIRKQLTADDASCVLTDAGDDVARARRQAGALLLAWSRQCPHAVRLSARRVDGNKRYVLVIDIGVLPPDLRTVTARKGAARKGAAAR